MAKHTLKEDNNFEELNLENKGTGTKNGKGYYGVGNLMNCLKSIDDVSDVKEGEYLDFSHRYFWDNHVEEILKKMNYKIKKGVTLDFSHNEIQGDCLLDFATIIPGEGATINFSNNPIGGLNAAYFIFKGVFPEGVTVNLSNVGIGDYGMEDYYEAYKHEIERAKYWGDTRILLRKGAELNLSNNNIGDKGAEILKDNMELEEGATLNLSNNNISDDMKKELKEWEKSEGINCKVIV